MLSLAWAWSAWTTVGQLAGCTPPEDDTTLLPWAPCGGGFTCTEIATDDGAEIEVVRHEGTDPDARVGVIAAGGPGSSSIDLLRVLIDAWAPSDPELWAGPTWIAMDNRGVGATDPIACVSDPWFDDVRGRHPAPATPEEEDGLRASAATFRDGCLADRDAAALADLGTPTYARDLDLVREAVGADTLDLLGFSYGTWIGAVYASMFPDRVGRFVLDGVVAPGETRDGFLTDQAQGFELALTRFFDRCDADPDCPLVDAAGVFDRVLAATASAPVPAPSDPEGRALTRNELRWGVTSLLYGPYDEDLALGLLAADGGDGGPMLAAADGGWGRDPDTHQYDLTYQGYWAIGCLDTPWPAGFTDADVWAFAASLEEDLPLIGASIVTAELNCVDWPATAPLTDIAAPDAPRLMLVAGQNDPATPFANAEAAVDALGNDSWLLPYEGDGHVAMFVDASGCSYLQERAFLLEGEPPTVDACP